MNGRLTEWIKLDYKTDSGIQEVKKSKLIPRLSEEKLARMLSVFAAIKDEQKILVDIRAEQEYIGKESQIEVYGHIPSAINIPWTKNLTAGFKKFRPANELKTLYADLDPAKEITVYCNRGTEIGVSYVVLRTLRSKVRSYDGSWFEWSLNKELPIVNESK
ncbi:MAG: hypothetical protein A6F71_00010 [Cycloclasticus sp. symbiont of Poecilosclerida sp. M]|nr:MAG: hypothetical protein A6F71_00010 [Cycloclasticus sp. symbiont of Poecilosclerida sp. M]